MHVKAALSEAKLKVWYENKCKEWTFDSSTRTIIMKSKETIQEI